MRLEFTGLMMLWSCGHVLGCESTRV